MGSRTHIKEIKDLDGTEVTVYGWVDTRRDHGKIIFIDLRDRTELVQVVFTPQIPDAKELRSGYVVRVKGVVKKRPKNMVNDKLENGAVEMEAKELVILNHSAELPLPLDTDGYEVNEEVRMKYRYLDLRRPRLKKNLEARHRIIKSIRDFLDAKGFWEIETPNLTKSTPEGARDYLVPSRIEQGKFYALPQSPQQYKQLLMVAGVEKYFQIARCFRDEDTRGDRQPEFTQLDFEMSFVEREDVMALNEELLVHLVRTLYPGKKIQETPFPRLTYADAMKTYGTDRPDLRKDKNDPDLLAFCWVIDFPFFEKDKEGKWTFTHNPFSAPKQEFLHDLWAEKNIASILTTQYDVVLNGFEIGGGSIRSHQSQTLMAVFSILGYDDVRIHTNFGHMLGALDNGAPPHGGIAWGLDRFVMLMQNEGNIREVIPFPKSGDGHDFMMDAPSEVDKKQLDELGLSVKREKNTKT